MSAHKNSVGDDLQSNNTDRMLMRDLSAKGAMFQPGVSNAILGLHQLENSNRGNNEMEFFIISDHNGILHNWFWSPEN